jgi:hypothetical protein
MRSVALPVFRVIKAVSPYTSVTDEAQGFAIRHLQSFSASIHVIESEELYSEHMAIHAASDPIGAALVAFAGRIFTPR